MSCIARVQRCIFALYYEFLVVGWAEQPWAIPHSIVERLLLLASPGYACVRLTKRLRRSPERHVESDGSKTLQRSGGGRVCQITLPEAVTTDVRGMRSRGALCGSSATTLALRTLVQLFVIGGARTGGSTAERLPVYDLHGPSFKEFLQPPIEREPGEPQLFGRQAFIVV